MWMGGVGYINIGEVVTVIDIPVHFWMVSRWYM